MSPDRDEFGRIAELSSLDEPVRRRLYEYVASRREPVARDDAAVAVGVGRSLAAYHLDKLAEAKLLVVSYARPHGRSGPGAGRPAKRYAPAAEELSISVPPRDYGRLAGLLAGLLAEVLAADRAGTPGVAIAEVARQNGRDAVTGADLLTALHRCGYRPTQTDAGDIELRNCPFHRIAHSYPELVCDLNLNLIQGMLEALGESPQRAVLAPCEGRCCVVVHPAD